MKRVNICLSEEQIKKLKQNKVDTGVNTSEVIRRLLEKFFEEKKRIGNNAKQKI